MEKITGQFPWGTLRVPNTGGDSYVDGLREDAVCKNYKYEYRRLGVKLRGQIKGQVSGIVALPSPVN